MSESADLQPRVANAFSDRLSRVTGLGSLSTRSMVSALLLLMLGVGIFLRIRDFGFPAYFTFDEELFASNAHSYLVGAKDANDHPPLGKLIQAVGLLGFGYNSVGWRFASVCFGLQTLVVAYWLGRALFGSWRSGAYAAALFAADGFFIAYSRAGLLDGILTSLVLMAVLAAVTARDRLGVVVSAVLVGLATSVKWSGALSGIPAAAAVLLLGNVPKSSVLVFALAPIVHVLVWMGGLQITGQPNDLRALALLMRELFDHHLELGSRHNDLASRWYSWLVLYHPIVVKYSQHGTASHYAAGVGNPLSWLLASSSAVAALLLTPFAALRVRPLRAFALREPRLVRVCLVLALGWFALLSPWTVARGSYTFMYHYLPSYGFALVLLGGGLGRLERWKPSAALLLCLAILALALFFAPVWGEFSLSVDEANRRLWFPTWRP